MILTLIEHDRGVINPYSLQLLAYTRELAAKDNTTLNSVLIGNNVQPLALELSTYGLDRIFLIQDDRLENYNAEVWAEGVIQLAEAIEPALIMAAATDKGNEVLSHIGAHLDIPMSANTSTIRLGDENKLIRYRWGSSLLEETIIKSKPLLITLALNLVKAEKVFSHSPEIHVNLSLTTLKSENKNVLCFLSHHNLCPKRTSFPPAFRHMLDNGPMDSTNVHG